MRAGDFTNTNTNAPSAPGIGQEKARYKSYDSPPKKDNAGKFRKANSKSGPQSYEERLRSVKRVLEACTSANAATGAKVAPSAPAIGITEVRRKQLQLAASAPATAIASATAHRILLPAPSARRRALTGGITQPLTNPRNSLPKP